MSYDLLNHALRDRTRVNWNRYYERRDKPEPFGTAEYELSPSIHEGASSFAKVREYIKRRKSPSR